MPGRTISHYELLEPLGRGGMGVVQKARDLKLDRLVALKFLSPELLGSADARARFLREARALSALGHPHIATVYEVDEADGAPFLAMEYLPGGTLRARVDETRAAGTFVPVDRLVEWGTGLAEGLAHAHAKGFVHRDVKSSNAMFDWEGRVKLTDFGLAKQTAGETITSAPGLAGTVAYMSPEQLAGEPADERSDLYALGVVLYETACGRLPFSARSPAELVTRIVSGEAPRLALVRPGLPAGFVRVVERLLAPSPADRYQTAQDALHDLGAIGALAAGQDRSQVSTLTAVPSGRRSLRRMRVPLLAAAGTVAAVAIGIAFWPHPAPLPQNKHVLVLPLRSIGGDAGQEVLCDGLTETLTTALTQTGVLSVVPASDARRVETVAQAHREFGVNLVLYGSLQRRGERLRLNLSLVDADRERLIGAENVDGTADQPFQIEQQMLDRVAELVDVAVPDAQASLASKGRRSAPEAFEAYLRGRGYLYRYDKPGNLERAREQLEEAVRRDPAFALARSALAETQLRLYRVRGEKPSLDAAQESAKSALALEPELATAHATYGAVLAASRQPDEAIAELEKAIALDPRDPGAYRDLAGVYNATGDRARAEEVYERAIRARPGDWRSYADLAAFYYGRQRYDEAERMYRKVIDLTPDNHFGYRNLGGLLIAVGRNDEAEAMLLKARSLKPSARAASNLGTLYMFEERYREAVPILEEASELAVRDAPNEYRIWGNLGDAYALAGEPADKASKAYGQAVAIAERLRQTSPEDADLGGVLAEYYAKLADRQHAVERIDAALAAAPESASVRYQAGLVYTVLGDEDRALSELREALARGFSADQIRRAPELKKLRARSEFTRMLEQAHAGA